MKLARSDQQYMTLALRLATKGQGRTSPNPMVGALVVSGNRIVGQGYHRQAGGPHAEVFALRQAGEHARGGTLYVTLEPCSHIDKRTPPCVPLLLKSGLRRVVIAMTDPNPRVNGQGIRALRRAGIKVTVGCRRKEAEELNAAYRHWIRTGRPLVILKAAMTLDGKIATASGESQWITGDVARCHAHQVRGWVDAVMVGVGTVLHDNPSLTARTSKKLDRLATRQPVRVIVDSRLRLPLHAKVVSERNKTMTIVATTKNASTAKSARLTERGVEMMAVPDDKGRPSLPALLSNLGRKQITSLLLEGGSQLNGAMLRARLVDRVMLYVAPRLLGGTDALSVIGGRSPRRLSEALTVLDVHTRSLGSDLLIEGRLTDT